MVSYNSSNRPNSSFYVPEPLSEIPISLIIFGSKGPFVDYVEFNNLRYHKCIIDPETMIHQLAVNYSVMIYNGDNYSEGVFDLPVPHCKHYRILLITFKAPESENKYYIIMNFVPRTFYFEIQPIATYEFYLLESSKFIFSTNIPTDNKFEMMRTKLKRHLNL